MDHTILVSIAAILAMSCNPAGLQKHCILGDANTPATIRERITECEPHTNIDIRTDVEGWMEHYLADDLIISEADLIEIENIFATARKTFN